MLLSMKTKLTKQKAESLKAQHTIEGAQADAVATIAEKARTFEAMEFVGDVSLQLYLLQCTKPVMQSFKFE